MLDSSKRRSTRRSSNVFQRLRVAQMFRCLGRLCERVCESLSAQGDSDENLDQARDFAVK